MLAVAGLLSSVLYLHLAGFDALNGVAHVGEFLATMGGLFILYALVGRGEHSWRGIWGWAVVFRLLLLPAGLPAGASWSEKAHLLAQDLRGEAVVYERFLLYDNDIWRYLWDGHLSAAGRNPYLEAPESGAAEGVWADVRDNVSYPQIPTLYPPLAQFLFRLSHLLAPSSILMLKLLTTGCDLGAGLFLALTLKSLGMNPARSGMYLWNPLVVKVFAGSGHIDSLMVLALAALGYLLARGFPWAASAVFGLAVLAKLSPLVLVGLLTRRLRPAQIALGLAVVVAGYGPYLAGGPAIFQGARTFGASWEFNAGVFNLVRWLVPGVDARVVCAALLVATLVWIWRRNGEFFASAADTLGCLVLLSPAVMPWYATWVLPYAILGRRWAWLVFTGLVCAAFGVMVDGQERPWLLAGEYGSLAAVWCWQAKEREVKK